MAISEQQIENYAFRVTKWTIEPNDEIKRHIHEFDYVVVPLVDAVMHVLDAEGSEASVEIRIGECYARQAGVEHTVINRGSEKIVFVEIEKL
jgi:mannose-6-phosphate isomerase-like protein (cupin superfamily)